MNMPSLVQAQNATSTNSTCTTTTTITTTTTWPWLQDTGLFDDDNNYTITTSGGQLRLLVQDPPLAPVDELDSRPTVRDLVARHETSIERLAQDLAATEPVLYHADKHDALWLLRYVLSHKGNYTAALTSARETLRFRHEHQLDETDLRGQPFAASLRPALKKYRRHCTEDAVLPILPNMQRGVVMFLRMAGVNAEAVYENLTEEEALENHIYQAEWTFQWLDYVTRTTGRLTKSLRIVDCEGYSLSTMTNRQVQGRNAKIAALMDSHYPQLLGRLLVIHASSWIYQPWRLLRPLFPKRLVEKVDFIDPFRRPKDLLKILSFVSKDFLPARYGGLNQVWPLIQEPF